MKSWQSHQLEAFSDSRGMIINILPEDVDIKSALFITGEPGAVRGQHYHKKDVHYCYCVSGEILFEAKNRETGEIRAVTMYPGDIVANDVNETHRFTFKQAGAFIALAICKRDQKSYEEDTIREDF